MTKIESSVVIKKPVEKVFAYATDIANNIKWQTDILEATLTSGKPFGLGSTYRMVNKFLGKRINTEGIIVEYEPDRICSYKVTSGAVTGESRFIFEPIHEGTRFTAVFDMNLGIFKVFKSLAVRTARRQVKNDLITLKHLMEKDSKRAA